MAVKSIVTYAILSADTATQLISAELSARSLVISDLILDAYAINQYPTDTFGVDDTHHLGIEKLVPNSLELSDAQAISFSTQIADALAVNDSADLLVMFSRSFADSATLSDVSVFSTEKNILDAIPFIEQSTFFTDLRKSESLKTEDIFSSSATFSRSFYDAFSLDDYAKTVGSFGAVKTNIFSLKEDFSFTFFAGRSATINKNALNTFTFNN